MIVHFNEPEKGDLVWRRFVFPDGQPHCEFDALALAALQVSSVELVGALRTPEDFVWAGLVAEALRSALPAATPINLDIGYMLGARMDRRIAPGQPATLKVLGALLNTARASVHRLRVLDPHSPATLEAIPGAEVLPADPLVTCALDQLAPDSAGGGDPVVVVPDAGARGRTLSLLARLGSRHAVVLCSKKRDPQTGRLSLFRVDEGEVEGKNLLIIDDICDGGGTFAGLAQVLHEQGAGRVHLCVTHGLLTKGWAIKGIDRIFTTDSAGMPCTAGLTLRADAGTPDLVHCEAEGKVRLTVMTRFVERMVEQLPA